MSSLNDVNGIPTEGKNLIVVAAVNNVLHFRIFDGDGKVVVNTDEKRKTEKARKRDCSIATGADSKIARQEQGESTWDPLNASELAPNSANGLIPSLIAWAKSKLPGNVAIVSRKIEDLRKQLESLWSLHELTESEKVRVITAVTSIVDYTPRWTKRLRRG